MATDYTEADAANALIAHNPRPIDKRLWSGLHEGERIRVIPCADDRPKGR